MDVQEHAARIVAAKSRCMPLSPLTEADGKLSIGDAWAIQDVVCEQIIQQGGRTLGWKLAATGPIGRQALNTDQPIYGHLLAEQFADGATISRSRFAGLGVEAEIAFRLGRKLAGPGLTSSSVRDSITCVMPAFELPDFVFSGKPNIVDFIAANAMPGGIVLGGEIQVVSDLADEEVVLEHNGQVVSRNRGAEVMGGPLNAVAWLANRFGERGLSLMPDDIVMSGGISALLRPAAGDGIIATFSSLGSVRIAISA